MRVPIFHGLSPLDVLRPSHGQSMFPFEARDVRYFYRARNAIYHLFLALVARHRRVAVLVPDYNSGNEVLAMRAAGASIVYCPVDRGMRMNPDDVERLCDVHRPDVLYVIHYAGWPQPISTLVDLCRRREMLLVEDCALSLLSETVGRPLGSFGDWSIFCLYKTLPVPNGAVLVQNTDREEPLPDVRLRPAGAPSTVGRVLELLVQRVRVRYGSTGDGLSMLKRGAGRLASAANVDRANVGDIGFDLGQVDLAISDLSLRLIDRVDLQRVRQRRIANYQTLSTQLGCRVSRPLPEPAAGVCPLFFPILVPNKRAVVDGLARRGVEALEFWNDSVEPGGKEMAATARFLREHVLELPLHQDLTERHMTYMAECLIRLNVRMPHAGDRILAA
ncbi:MAG TPA: DegT/DnrJ/EryC1/StrS family aminotransferase [Vicinamibacterales bacterium]